MKTTNVKASDDAQRIRVDERIHDLEVFSVGISHDLRAPLRAIIGFSRALLEDYSSGLDATGQDYLQRINTASARMDQLIHDALLFGQVDKRDLILSAVKVEDVVRSIIEIYPELAPTHITITVAPKISPVLAQESILFQCVSNILMNASKFVARGTRPEVMILSQRIDARVRLLFKDNGIGIAREHQASIFQLFQRVDQNSQGTGIGLAIVKRAVERMGGAVGVDSILTEGSTFWIELPAVDHSIAIPGAFRINSV